MIQISEKAKLHMQGVTDQREYKCLQIKEKEMIQDIEPKIFDNAYKKIQPGADDPVFVFKGQSKRNDRVLMKVDEGDMIFPTVGEMKAWGAVEEDFTYLFSIDEEKYFLYMNFDKLSAQSSASQENIPEETGEYSWERIVRFRRNLPQYRCFAGMTAYHLYDWYRANQYCGRCGRKAVHDQKERMMRCSCGNMIFPKIAPAVIIGLRHGDSLMMSRYAGREYKGRALLAGFCEIGETPEQTVVREVMEEVGLRAKNVTYYASQPWGFDSNLLLGYYCDLDGDSEITLDKEELASARFVAREDIEYDPNLLSLTATMIEAFRKGEDK